MRFKLLKLIVGSFLGLQVFGLEPLSAQPGVVETLKSCGNALASFFTGGEAEVPFPLSVNGGVSIGTDLRGSIGSENDFIDVAGPTLFIQVFPNMLKHLRDQKHLSASDISVLLHTLHEVILDKLSGHDGLLVEVEGENQETLSPRSEVLLAYKFLLLSGSASLEELQNLVEEVTSDFEERLREKGWDELIDYRQERGGEFQGWVRIGMAPDADVAAMSSRFARDGNVGHFADSFLQQHMIDALKRLQEVRTQLLESSKLNLFTTEEAFSDDFFRKLRKSNSLEDIERKFQIDHRDLQEKLLTFKRLLEKFIPAPKYRRQDALDAESQNTQPMQTRWGQTRQLLIFDLKGVEARVLKEVDTSLAGVMADADSVEVDLLEILRSIRNEDTASWLHHHLDRVKTNTLEVVPEDEILKVWTTGDEVVMNLSSEDISLPQFLRLFDKDIFRVALVDTEWEEGKIDPRTSSQLRELTESVIKHLEQEYPQLQAIAKTRKVSEKQLGIRLVTSGDVNSEDLRRGMLNFLEEAFEGRNFSFLEEAPLLEIEEISQESVSIP